MATPTITFNSATLAGSSADLVIAYPANIATGDVLVIFAATDTTTGISRYNTPTGYTHRGTFGSRVSDAVIDVFTKVADGTETGNVSVVSNTGLSFDRVGFCIRVTGSDGVTWDTIGAEGVNAGTTVVAPTITTGDTDALVFCVNAFDGADGAPFTYSNSFSAISNANVGGAWGIALGFGTRSVASAGAVGATTVTASASDGQVAVQLSIFSAHVPSTPPVNTTPPTLSSNSTVYGSLFTASSDGIWTGSPTPTFTRKWYRDGVEVPGETGLTFLTDAVAQADLGVSITFKTTATNSEGSAVEASNALVVTSPNQLPAKTFTIHSRLESPFGTLESIDYSGRNHDNDGGFIAQNALTLVGSSIRVRKSGGLDNSFDLFVRINGGSTQLLESESASFETSAFTTSHSIAIAKDDEVEILFSTTGVNNNMGVSVSVSFEDTTAKSTQPFMLSAFFNGVTASDREAIFSGNSHNFNCEQVASNDFTITSIGYHCENGALAETHTLSIEINGVTTSIGGIAAGQTGGIITGLDIVVAAGDLIQVWANDGVGNGEECRIILGCSPLRGDPYSTNEFLMAFQDTDLKVAQLIAPFVIPFNCKLVGCSFQTSNGHSSSIDMVLNGGAAVEILNYNIGGSPGMQSDQTLNIDLVAGDQFSISHNGTGTTGNGGTTTLFFLAPADDLPEIPLSDDTWPSEPTDDFPEALPYGSLNGASGGPQGNKVAFEPEFGPHIDRRKGSYAARYISIELPPLTPGQYETWQNFYHTFLKNGSIPMTYPDPITKAKHLFQFKQGKPGVREAALPDGRIKINFDLIRID